MPLLSLRILRPGIEQSLWGELERMPNLPESDSPALPVNQTLSDGVGLLNAALAIFDHLSLHGLAAKTSEALDEARRLESLQNEANSTAA